MNQNLENFMKELSELSKKYGYKISGCGCCGSPSVESSKENQRDEIIDFIEWLENEQVYEGGFYNFKTKDEFVYKTPKDE